MARLLGLTPLCTFRESTTNKVSTLDYTIKFFQCLNKPNVALFSFILQVYPLFYALFLGGLISYNTVKGKNGWLSALALPEFQIFLQVTYQLVTRMSEIQASVG